ncbi:MAG: cytochrome c [Nitrospinae bacterium]|nr:cytochrome c [Nitrospinota bacterium]
MGKWVVVSFLVLGGALVVFLLIFQNPRQEEALLTTGDGAAIYIQTCAACHGERGEGRNELGNPLRGRALPPAYIKEVIQRGRNKMPALPHIQGEALENVARYVNRLP